MLHKKLCHEYIRIHNIVHFSKEHKHLLLNAPKTLSHMDTYFVK